mgnify:CR=1 FL=1
MFNTTELYELSFVAPNRKRRTKPQLLFSIKVQYLEEIATRLQTLSERYRQHAERYCPHHANFYLPLCDLFGHVTFGYGRCGFVKIDDSQAHLHVELRGGESILASTLTIHHLSLALGLPIEGMQRSNQVQQIDVITRCEHAYVYGHAVSGYVSSRVRSWLIQQGSKTTKEHSAIDAVISTAMRTTWKAIIDARYKPSTRDFYTQITSDGRFSLNCPGNACDLSIYPDQIFRGDSNSPVQFSCHNLDSAHQQLALLAGLAKLCELARKDEQ